MSSLVYSGKLSDKEIQLIKEEANKYKDKAFLSGVGNANNGRVDLKQRNSLTFFPKPHHAFNTFNILQSLVVEHLHWIKDIDITNIAEIQYVRYEEGGFFSWHRDPVSSRDMTRGFTLSLNLSPSDNYIGGDLLVKRTRTERYQLGREPGSFIMFPAFYLHAATKVTQGIREAIVVWTTIKAKDLDKIKDLATGYM